MKDKIKQRLSDYVFMGCEGAVFIALVRDGYVYGTILYVAVLSFVAYVGYGKRIEKAEENEGEVDND